MENKTNMDSKYAEILLELYKNDNIHITWGITTFFIKLKEYNLNKDISNFLFKLNHSADFMKYATRIVDTIFNIINNNLNDEIISQNYDLIVAKQILDFDKELKNHLYLKKHYITNCYRHLEYEIATQKLITSSNVIEDQQLNFSVLKIHYEIENKEKQICLQMSKKDLQEFISQLQILEKQL